MRAAVLLVLAALLGSGCSSKPPAAPTATSSAAMDAHMGHDAGGHLLAPTWTLGQFWTMESPQGGTFSHVVSKDAGDDWVVDTDNPDLAFFDATSDISFLGKVRKADLAGSQGSQRVQFLQFPLEAHMNWTTTWDGQPTLVHVLSVQDGKATLKAVRANSNVAYADYTYDDKAGYFSHFAFYDDKGQSVDYEWTLRSSGVGFSAPLVRWALHEDVNVTGAIPSGAQSTTFTVPAGLTDLWVQATVDCTAGAFAAAIGPFTGPADNRGYSTETPCPYHEKSGYSIAAPAQAETWGDLVTGGPAGTTGTIDLHLYERTQVTFQAGQAPS